MCPGLNCSVSLFFALSLIFFHFITSHYLSGEWAQMSEGEALDYYTSKEVCLIVGGDNCNTEPGLAEPSVPKRKCRSHIYMHRHHSSRPWPESKNVGDLLKLMDEKGSNTLFLVGDSFTMAMYGNAKAVAQRISFEVKEFDENHFSGFEHSALITLPSHLLSDNQNNKELYIHTMNLAKVNSQQALKVDDIKQHIDERLQSEDVKGKALFVINLGLHFQEDPATKKVDEYTHLMQSFLPVFVAYAEDDHTVVYRETSATHYPTPSGAYNPQLLRQVDERKDMLSVVSLQAQKMYPNPDAPPINESAVVSSQAYPDIEYHYCSPIRNEEAYNAQNWQNPIVEDILHDLDKQSLISTAPFFKATAALYAWHEGGNRDCTHFCWSPLLWIPVWDFVVRFFESKNS